MSAPAAPSIPMGLDRLQRFVNTLELDPPQDAFADPTGVADWMVAERLAPPGVLCTPTQRRRAVSVREGLRQLLLANNGEQMDPDRIREFDAVAARLPLRLSVGDPQGPSLVAAGKGVDSALGELLATVSAAVAAGTWCRLKACRDHSCEWAFYDHSRNSCRSWCSMAVCGNRTKAREFRRRHTTGPPG